MRTTHKIILALQPLLLILAANDLSHSNPKHLVPWIDYDGIEAAAAEAVAAEHARMSSHNGHSKPPHKGHVPKCKKISKRKEWRQLKRSEKKEYLKAVKCLTKKPDYGISPVSDKLYDAFTQVHQTNWTDFHSCASFLPWHRWFVWLRTQAMEHECGYKGPFPYWNYTMDWKDPHGSPIFSPDPEIGFGSHGTEVVNEIGVPSYKVDNGAFAGLRVALPVPHYLVRNFSVWKDIDPTGLWGNAFGNWFSPDAVTEVLQSDSFWDFEVVIDGLNNTSGFLHLGIHNGVHFNNAGDWNGPLWLFGTQWFPVFATAPNDPMFFPHHQYMDSVFWAWQQKPGKQWQYNGSKNFSDLTLRDATPFDLLPFYGLGPDPPVTLALKTESWPLCYTY